MKYIETNWDVPYYNMAFENYVMNSDEFDDDYFFFYVHRPSIIIGKHQNAYQEINRRYVEEKGIIVSRRNTGGGAVYHDGGNLNYSFIMRKHGDDAEIDFEKYTAPVISALRKLGINAELSGRNDIMADGRKISGNAQGHNRRKVLHHGTLLFDVNIEEMVNALNVSDMKIQSKAIRSVRSRVMNIREHLNDDMDMASFRNFILNEIFESGDIERRELTGKDLDEVKRLVDEKYSTWDFNFGYSPKFEITRSRRIEGVGIIEAGLSVKDGRITQARFSGDYFSLKDGLEDVILGARFSREGLDKAIGDEELSSYISGLDKKDFISIFFE